MAKSFDCRSLGMDCDWKVTGATEEEVIQKCAEHARSAHNMKEIPPEVTSQIRASIRDVA